MACYHPILAWQKDDGQIVFAERGKIRRELRLYCGRCIGCRIQRARNWAVRCMHESQLHGHSYFATLTYDNDNYSPSLDYRDFQLFMKRLRKAEGPTRFFACGEYGEEFHRPHFHVLLFGKYFDDQRKVGKELYESKRLDQLWKHGRATLGSVTYQSAGYCAQYSCKKVNGPMADEHYKRVNLSTGEIVDVAPEMGRMSLRPAIGYPWFLKFWKDVYLARDAVIINGRPVPPPRFYDLKLRETAPEIADDKAYERYINSAKFVDDCTPERLATRELVAKAKFNSKVRSYR